VPHDPATGERPTRNSRKIRAAGAVCCAASLVGAAGGVYLAVAGPVAGLEGFSYPHAVPGFTALQMVLALTSVGLIVGLLAVRWSGAVPWTRRAQLGYFGAIAALAGLTVAEGIAITVTQSTSDVGPPAFGVVYAGYTILLAAALLTVGFDVARGLGRGWSRWLPFALAAWLLVVVVPALATSFTAALWAISAWLLLFAVLGLVLILDADQSDRRPAGPAPASTSARAAAVLTWTYVAAFGSPVIPNVAYLLQNGTLPAFLDMFTMYGGPLSVRLSEGWLVGALVAFLLVTLVAAWAAWLVWNGSKVGAIVGLVVLPVEAAFWIGFALPLPWVIGLARLVLLALAWNSLYWPASRSRSPKAQEAALPASPRRSS
jgi:hypothetical protein